MARHLPARIVSGGQTGADRGGLEAALLLGIDHGGWCPLGRRAEEGPIPEHFELKETETADYSVRTRLNVRDSDATVLFTRGEPKGGSALTARLADEMERPLLHVDLEKLDVEDAVEKLLEWLDEHRPRILNVAGSRESQSPGIGKLTRQTLVLALEE